MTKLPDRSRRHDDGAAIVFIVVVMGVFVALLLPAFSSLSLSNLRSAVNQEKSTQAYYIARAGAEAVSQYIVNLDPTNIEGFVNQIVAESENEADYTNPIYLCKYYDEPCNYSENPCEFDETNEPCELDVFRLKLWKHGSDIVIHSTGYSGGVSNSVRVLLELTQESYNGGSDSINIGPFDMAVFADEYFNMGGSSTIYGSVGMNTIVERQAVFGGSTQVLKYGNHPGNFYVGPGGNRFEVIETNRRVRNDRTPCPPCPDPKLKPWTQVEAPWLNIPNCDEGWEIGKGVLDEERFYPAPIFPDFPDNLENKGVFRTPWVQGEYYEITEDGYYELLEATGNRTITIDLGGGDRIIRVKNLNIQQGHIKLINKGENGRLLLYVEDNFTFSGSSTLNNDNNEHQRVILYYKGGGVVSFGGNTRFMGTLFLESAAITITGSNGVLGHIISGGNSVSVTGNAEANVRVLYAPNANVSLGGSGRVRGAIIANRFNAVGNARVYYDDSIRDSSFIGSIIGGNGEPDNGVLRYRILYWMEGREQQQ